MDKILIALITIVVVGTIFFVLRRQQQRHGPYGDDPKFEAELSEKLDEAVSKSVSNSVSKPRLMSESDAAYTTTQAQVGDNKVITLNVFAREGQQFAGYELLQALLSAGMRFGDMGIFHRYQQDSGKGTIMFSLASATEPGTFDIHAMGGFACRGLTLFMCLSGHSGIDQERFDMMMNTAKQLTDDLNGMLLDAQRQMLSQQQIQAYQEQITAT